MLLKYFTVIITLTLVKSDISELLQNKEFVSPDSHVLPSLDNHGPPPVYKKILKIDHEEGPSEYKFNYGVHDDRTKDIKSQEESRTGDVVKGRYELIDSDGYKRIVEYTADDHNGFQAIVHREKTDIIVPVPEIVYHENPSHTDTYVSGHVKEYIPIEDNKFSQSNHVLTTDDGQLDSINEQQLHPIKSDEYSDNRYTHFLTTPAPAPPVTKFYDATPIRYAEPIANVLPSRIRIQTNQPYHATEIHHVKSSESGHSNLIHHHYIPSSPTLQEHKHQGFIQMENKIVDQEIGEVNNELAYSKHAQQFEIPARTPEIFQHNPAKLDNTNNFQYLLKDHLHRTV